MPKYKLNNGKIYDLTEEAYQNFLNQGLYIEKVADDKKPDVLKEKEAAKAVKE
jgi:hypothetical protein